jgi:uncharacterized protein YegJ (DUF2314 family)
MRILRLLATIAFLSLAGCGDRVKDIVEVVKDDDPKMQAAIAKARSTVPEFIAALKAKIPGTDGFAVKVLFKDGDKGEHMWISRPTYVGGKFHGVIGNEPKFVRNVRLGQLYSVAPTEITDWMYVEKGKLVGGYTLRAIRDAKTPEERAAMDRELPFTID